VKWHKTRKACEILNVHPNTLRLWDRQGKIPTQRTPGGHRLYDISAFYNETPKTHTTICYCRVSSQSQRTDLNRQVEFMKERYPESEVIKDVGSGINFKRKGLRTLLERSLSGEQLEIVVAYKDRLARFGFDLLEWLISRNGGRIVVLNKVSFSPEQELTKDLLTILHVFSCRLYGLRKYKKEIQNDTEVGLYTEQEDSDISKERTEEVIC
jgi:predicted site-specific integrase-resolvase